MEGGSRNNLIGNNFYNNLDGILISGTSNNSITGGSIRSSTSWDYWLASIGSTSNFTNTNFTGSRKINFNDATSWFNYRNETSELWLKTKVSTFGVINRTINKWSQTNMSWNESANRTVTATYNITGLLPNTKYMLYNYSVNFANTTTDATGNNLSFKFVRKDIINIMSYHVGCFISYSFFI